MKKIFSLALAVMLCLSFLYISASAEGASAVLTGPETVRGGDTITLTFKLNGTGLLGAQGELSYDPTQVELKSTAAKIASPWMVEFNGNKFVAYDNNQENPINEETAIFTATFKIKDLAVGTEVTISVINVRASAGMGDDKLGTISYTTTMATPKSAVNSLKSLQVNNGTMTPAFNSQTTLYNVNVPFSVTKLDITYEKTDDKSKVRINSPELLPGGTTKVTVTVTAENGKIRIYTLAVKRENDPNYVPGSNNNLSGIRVGGFVLSPVFSPDRTNYVVWLPYETNRVTVTGMTEDSKASVRVEGGTNLVAGSDNEIRVICVAENGDEKVYTVIAKRAPAHDAQPTQPSTQPETRPTTQPGVPAGHVCPPGNNIPIAMVIIPWVLAIAALIVLLLVLMKDMKKND